jgi:hypothetical protein
VCSSGLYRVIGGLTKLSVLRKAMVPNGGLNPNGLPHTLRVRPSQFRNFGSRIQPT